MDADAIIKARLAADATLTALVSTRIYPDRPEQDVLLGCVVYSRNAQDDTTFAVLNGTCTLYQAKFAIACIADDKAPTQAIADAVVSCLNGYKTTDCQGVFYMGQEGEPLENGYLTRVYFTGYFVR